MRRVEIAEESDRLILEQRWQCQQREIRDRALAQIVACADLDGRNVRSQGALPHDMAGRAFSAGRVRLQIGSERTYSCRAIAIDISGHQQSRANLLGSLDRSIHDGKEISRPPMIGRHRAHEDGIRALAERGQLRGVRGIRRHRTHGSCIE